VGFSRHKRFSSGKSDCLLRGCRLTIRVGNTLRVVTVYFSSLKLTYPRRGALFRAGSKKGKVGRVGDVQTTSQRILACFVAQEFQGGIGVCPVAPGHHPASTWPPRPRPKTGKGSGETAGVISGVRHSGFWHLFIETSRPSNFMIAAFLD